MWWLAAHSPIPFLNETRGDGKEFLPLGVTLFRSEPEASEDQMEVSRSEPEASEDQMARTRSAGEQGSLFEGYTPLAGAFDLT